jgi:hypothetical protein
MIDSAIATFHPYGEGNTSLRCTVELDGSERHECMQSVHDGVRSIGAVRCILLRNFKAAFVAHACISYDRSCRRIEKKQVVRFQNPDKVYCSGGISSRGLTRNYANWACIIPRPIFQDRYHTRLRNSINAH